MALDIVEASAVAPALIATLARHNLVAEQPWAFGSPEGIRTAVPGWTPTEAGLVVSPSWLGLDLALRGDGPTSVGVADFLYAVGWSDIPEVDIEYMSAHFPSAPRDLSALRVLRDQVGHLVDIPEQGWAVPRPGTDELADADPPA